MSFIDIYFVMFQQNIHRPEDGYQMMYLEKWSDIDRGLVAVGICSSLSVACAVSIDFYYTWSMNFIYISKVEDYFSYLAYNWKSSL